MATKIVMAQLSPTMEEGKLLEWKVAEGDKVEASDLLAEIETDKANMDIEAMGGGVVLKLLAGEGDTVPVGALIGIIGEEGEDISALLKEAEAAADGQPVAEEAPAEEEAVVPPAPAKPDSSGPGPVAESEKPAEKAAAVEEADHSRAGESSVTGAVKASPLARRMAEEAGLSVSDIEGSGPGGRVVKRDVEAAIAAGTSGEREAAGSASGAPPAASGPQRLVDQTLEPSQMRKAIARRLVTSIGPVPHFFLTTEVDMGRVLELRKSMNSRLEGAKIGVNDILIKVTAEALVRHPEINASWEGDTIRRHGSADIGVAVAIEDGLITPIVRQADRKGLLRISEEAAELIERARAKRLEPEEYQGATFSVSNLGMFDIDEFTAIINPPEAGILAVGSTNERVVVVDGEMVIRQRMRVTMSCDHRVIDGATGARFLQTWKAMLENPLELVL
jgi:pyruvate dehydrogenase E2 component (dihydrolipoamide acetyltransferase)